MHKTFSIIFMALFLVTLISCGGSTEEVELDPQQATAQAIVEKMQGAAATAEASTTSTALMEYGGDVMDARNHFDQSGVSNYRWKYAHVNPAGVAQQKIEITVENGQVVEFKHDCSPDNICLKMPVDNQADWAVPGVLDQLLALAEQRHAMAIVRFDEEYGFPAAIVANSDEAPYYIQWTTEEFEVLEETE